MSSELVEDAAERLRELRVKADQLRTEIARAEAELEVAESRREEVRREIESLGVDPDRVRDELVRLEREVREAMADVETFLVESSRLIERGNTDAAGVSENG